MRVMPTVKFGDRFGIAFSGFGLDQHTLLEMCLELALQRDEERGAIVTVPIGEAAWYDLGVVDLNLHLWSRGSEAYIASNSRLRWNPNPAGTIPSSLSFNSL